MHLVQVVVAVVNHDTASIPRFRGMVTCKSWSAIDGLAVLKILRAVVLHDDYPLTHGFSSPSRLRLFIKNKKRTNNAGNQVQEAITYVRQPPPNDNSSKNKYKYNHYTKRLWDEEQQNKVQIKHRFSALVKQLVYSSRALSLMAHS